MGLLANSKITWVKRVLIFWVIKQYQVDLSEAEQKNPHEFESFNDFFTRKLDLNLRTIALNHHHILSPVDGIMSQFGHIQDNQLFIAKGKQLSLNELLQDASMAEQFKQGSFANLYLAPQHYHRVHMPLSGQIDRIVHLPGHLFSVKPRIVEKIPNLFGINERAVCLFDTEQGKMAIILIGALIVGGIQTHFTGLLNHNKPGGLAYTPELNNQDFLQQAEEMGLFQFGSTVILLFEQSISAWQTNLAQNMLVKMGQSIASYTDSTTT